MNVIAEFTFENDVESVLPFLWISAIQFSE